MSNTSSSSEDSSSEPSSESSSELSAFFAGPLPFLDGTALAAGF